ncbi:MAG: fimbrillin family protein [Phocaeicola sp.]
MDRDISVVESQEIGEKDFASSFDTSLEGVYPLSRSISLPIDSEILINATGSLSAFNRCYRWNGFFWQGDNELFWDEKESDALLVALYPYYDQLLYTENELYGDGRLIDVLYDVLELPYQSEIELTFKHRFSLLTVTLSPEVERGLTALWMKMPCSIVALSPTTADLQYDFTKSQSVCLTSQEEGGYQFIIPPVSDLELEITLEWRGELYTHVLAPSSFESNHRYAYHLKSVEESVGIRTVEDFIAFAKLYTNQSYAGEKSLSDFGEEKSGVMTYYLLNDLCFTPEESARLSMIGSTSSPFNDCFEGNNHFIRGLDLNSLDAYAGLFRKIGKEGVVRNIHVRDSRIVRTGTSVTYFSFIAVVNEGLIDHCSVENCSFSLVAGVGGAIASSSYGAIVNCWSWGSRFACGADGMGAGAIVDCNYGDVYNCFSGENTFVNDSKSIFSGICLRASGGKVNIANSYYKASGRPLRTGAMLNDRIGAPSVLISNCFYSLGPLVQIPSSSIIATDCYLYDAAFRYNETHSVLEALNKWVDEVGSELPYQFKRWRVGDNEVPASFE